MYSIIIVPIEASAGRDTGGEHALIQLSEDTGGRFFYATSAPQLDDAFRQISDELRTQYLLAYYPSQRLSDSNFRRIQVEVSGPATSTPFSKCVIAPVITLLNPSRVLSQKFVMRFVDDVLDDLGWSRALGPASKWPEMNSGFSP